MIREAITYLLLFITTVNTYFLYFKDGYLAGMPGNKFAIITIIILFIIFLFFYISNLSNKRSTKKNSLRVSFTLIVILFFFSLYSRAFESQDYYFLWRWSQTILYGLIILFIVAVSDKLYLNLKKLSSN